MCGIAVFLQSCGGGDSTQSAPAVKDIAFSLPRCISVSVAPYPSIDAALADEQIVDWLHDAPRSRAVTLAYAARELQSQLALAALQVTVAAPEGCGSSSVVLATAQDQVSLTPAELANLNVNYASLGDQGYAIVPYQTSLYVTGNTRVSVLSGVYRLLDYLGFAWYDPSETVVPDLAPYRSPVLWPRLLETPRLQMRGFWIFGTNPIPDGYAVWLARNRFNVGGTAKPYLQHKLGLIGWGGGHELLQQEFSRPGLFAQHPDWYGMLKGVRQPVPASGPYYNIAFANADAASYFAGQMIQRLETGDLQSIDVLNIWPADNRFNAFDQSPEALALGNESDNLLKFYGVVQDSFTAAYRSGRLSRPDRSDAVDLGGVGRRHFLFSDDGIPNEPCHYCRT